MATPHTQEQLSDAELVERWPQARRDLWKLEGRLCFDYLITSQRLSAALHFAAQTYARLAGEPAPINPCTVQIHTIWDRLRPLLSEDLSDPDDVCLGNGQLEIALQLADREVERLLAEAT